jgi:tetraacyldisaccharide-1-P 4'-kinase
LVAKGAKTVLTTEKDAINLCDLCDDLLDPLPLYWLKIGMKIENEPDFIRAVETRLA